MSKNDPQELNDIFDDLDRLAYDSEYHHYLYKETNQVVREHFEKLYKRLKKLGSKELKCNKCGKIYEKSTYCIAQNAMGYDVTFTCECENEILFKPEK